MQRWVKFLQKQLIKAESLLSVGGVAVIVGILLYLVAWALISGATSRPGPHGVDYMAMSSNPFDYSQSYAVGYRRLGPILGYLTGLRGDRFLWLTSLAAAAIPAVLYLWARKRRYSPALALGMAALVATSGVLLIHFIARGYVDPIYYLFALVAFLWRKNGIFSAAFMLLAIMTHECVLVLLPAWWAYGWAVEQRIIPALWRSTGMAIVVLALWGAWRYYLEQAVFADFNFPFYFTWGNVKIILKTHLAFLPVGAFYALKLGWAVPFRGLQTSIQKASWPLTFTLIILFLGVCAQALIALDIGRLFSLAFPMIPIAMTLLWTENEDAELSQWIWNLNLANVPLFFYYVAANSVHPLLPYPLQALIDGL